jgi:hypothetical protein
MKVLVTGATGTVQQHGGPDDARCGLAWASAENVQQLR